MRRLAFLFVATAASPPARAHGSGEDLHHLLTLDPLVLACLGAAVVLYAGGLARLWRVRTGHGVRPWQAGSYAAGILLLVLALIWPLDALADWSFAAHMLQHLLLIALAPPLLVLGAPLAPLAALRSTRVIVRRMPWARLGHPLALFSIHGAVVWAWHAPALFQAALRSTTVHTLEHVTMLTSALLFWWVLLQAGRARVGGSGAALVWLFLTMTHMGVLGALITFAPRVLYPAYGERPEALGLSPLEDQQLAGLIMWVPGGLVYLAAALVLAAAWLRQAERRVGWTPPPV